MKRIFWIIMFFFLQTAPVFAMTTEEIKDLLTPHKDDAAIQYLGFIFGTVSPSLADRGLDGNSQVFGHMMGVLNGIAEVVGIVLLIYIIIVGTINTASSGKILGEKWNGTWLPMRSALGIALLMPGTKTAYCLAQVMVMWIVYYGVGAASSLWSVTVDYLDTHNIYSTAGMTEAHTDNIHTAKDSAVAVYKDLVCNAWHTNHSDKTPYSYGIDKANSSQVNFGYANNDNGIQPDCGAITLRNPAQASYVIRLANDFQQSAYSFVKDKNFPDSNTVIRTILDQYVSDLETLNSSLKNVYEGTVVGQMTSYRNMGWLLAGDYYRELMKDRTIESSAFDFPTASIEQTNNKGVCDDLLSGSDAANCVSDMATGSVALSTRIDDIVQSLKQNNGKPGVSSASKTLNATKNAVSGSLPSWYYALGVGSSFNSITDKLIDHFGSADGSLGLFEGTGDPFAELITFGQALMTTASSLLVASLIGGSFVFMTIAGWCSAQSPMAVAGQTVQSVISSLMMGIIGFAYTQGVMLAIYLPLIPCIVFLVGSIGWFISVIEAIVAAPLVAVGLLWPDAQNEVLGRAEPAMMLLLNLFLRPSLMVVGLISGILLCWISFKLLHIAFSTMIATGFLTFDFGLSYLALGFIYATMNLALAKKSFSMIHVIPDKVMSWIGDHSQGHGNADEIAGTLNSGAERAAGNISGISSGAGQYLGYGGQDAAKKIADWRFKRNAKNNQLSVGD